MTLMHVPLTLTRRLGEFASTLQYDDLPGDVVHFAKRALVDWSSAALAGPADPAAERVRRVIGAIDDAGPGSVLGSPLNTAAPWAALANAYASHLLDYDDVFNPIETTIHLSSCVWPAVLAVAQLRHLDGRAAIAAYVAGFEVGARVARAAGPTHYQSAWHVTGTCGHVAAAAAAACALRLSPEAATHALGCSATQGSGLREVYGSDTKALHPGKAAMDGVLAGLLAEAGFTSTDTAIEGERGLLRAVSQSPDNTLLVEGLGTHWNLVENGNKLYPTASLTHAPIEAATAAAASGITPAQIGGVVLRVHPFTATVTALAQPANGPEARFSTPHGVAVALLRGSLGLPDFDDATVNDPAIKAMRARITLVADKDMDKRGCELILQLHGGSERRFRVERNKGTPAAPLTDDELTAKFNDAATRTLPDAAIAAGAARLWRIDGEDDMDGLVRSLGSAWKATPVH